MPELSSLALERTLLYGARESRQRLALQLAESFDAETCDMLVATLRSAEDWRLRARCLELLGLAAGTGSKDLAEAIIAAVLAGPNGSPNADKSP